MKITAAELVELSGIPRQTIRDLVETGVLVPAYPGSTGRGNSHKFNLMQAVGLGVAQQLRVTQRGCSSSYLAQVVAAFSGLDERHLLVMFRDGRTHFAGIHYERPHLQGKQQGPVYDWPNVEEVYRHAKGWITKSETVTV